MLARKYFSTHAAYSQQVSSEMTRLHLAACFGAIELVEPILWVPDIDAKDTYGRTPLFCVVSDGHEAVIKLLLEAGADLNRKDVFRETPLQRAARNGHEAIVELFQSITSLRHS